MRKSYGASENLEAIFVAIFSTLAIALQLQMLIGPFSTWLHQ
jgi:hypothetical protein